MSQNPVSLPVGAPLSPAQQQAVQALLGTLSTAQVTWLSGYLAAIGHVASGTAAAPAAAAGAVAAPAGMVPLTVLYGTESGNSEACAAEAVKAATKAGFKATMVDMGDYDRGRLAAEQNLLVIVSTWGEGDPPERAAAFHEFVHSRKAPQLPNTRFTVCALGDTSYADFCACGIQFDQQLEKLGARRVHPRTELDVDFEEPFRAWLSGAVAAMAEAAGINAKAEVAEPLGAASAGAVPAVSVLESAPVPAAPAAAGPAEAYGKKRPFPAPLRTKINLNGTGSAKETYHLEFSLEGSGLSYEPGDVVGIFPYNCPEVVEDLLQQAGLRGDEVVEDESGARSLREVLLHNFDITSINALIAKKYAPLAKNPALDELLDPANKERLNEWLWGREVRDLFNEFPSSEPLAPVQLLELLRKMPPRLYSIASSIKAHPGEVHLTVGVVSYQTHGRYRKGVCSTYLGHRVEEGDKVLLYTHANKNFGLPADPATPIIMVGPGTGIAPFRAFVEERAVTGARGRNWLFFGEQHFNTDFLYQTEWQDYLKSGVLTRMDVAFSRDTPQKIYVQHRMKEKAADLYAWLQEGAYFYVCGDATRMAKDVHTALIEIYCEQGGLSPEAAEAEVKQLQKDRRYQRDVY